MASFATIAITLLFMVGDIITGLVKGWKEEDVQSRILREGLFHKAAFISVIFLAQGLEYAADRIPQIELNMPISIGVCAYIILTECVSILENLRAINPDIDRLNLPFPKHDDLTHNNDKKGNQE